MSAYKVVLMNSDIIHDNVNIEGELVHHIHTPSFVDGDRFAVLILAISVVIGVCMGVIIAIY